MTSIPASQLVAVNPGVLGPGGNPLALNSVFFTADTSIPIGTVKSFATLADVQAWFGPSSDEAAMAAIYFNGFTNATLLPGLIYFAQFNTALAAGYMRGGSLAGVALTAIQALSGTLTLSIDGVSTVSGAINLAGATSFSNAAALIQTALQAGTPVNTATVTYDSQRQAFKVTSPTTGASSSITVAAVSALATGLKLTAAAGAVASPGAAIATPAGAMATLTALTQNFAGVMTMFEPITADKVLWATAISALGQRYFYVGWDTTAGPDAGVDPTSFGALTKTMTGRIAVWGAAGLMGVIAKAAFICGTAASLDKSRTNGRITFAYKGQAGLVPDVTNATVANNLLSNGYNFYGAYATANDQFQFLQNGQISGVWNWIDPYVNQILMNSDFQLALMVLESQVNSLPYAQPGYDSVRAALLDPIRVYVNFGAIVAGVTLSASQRQQVNTANGGRDVASTIQSTGWYLQILDASPTVRGLRGSPPMTFWYTDGGSIQKLVLASIDIQ